MNSLRKKLGLALGVVSIALVSFMGVPSTHTIDSRCGRDIYEPNNMQMDAKPLPRTGVMRNAVLCPAGDEDYYTITVSAKQPNIKLILKGLPQEMGLTLFDSNRKAIAWSQSTLEDVDELIANNLAPGTYAIMVANSISAPGNSPYYLRMQTRSSAFKSLYKKGKGGGKKR